MVRLLQTLMKALVVFHRHGTHMLARWLKRGFKHCFVAVESDGYWIVIDGKDGVPAIDVVAGSDFDLAEFYRSKKYTVIETQQHTSEPSWPLAVDNCVGLVKCVLAIDAPLVFTPYQLFRHLQNGN